MSFVTIESQLRQATSAFDLARRLGRVSLKNGARLRRLAEQPAVEPFLAMLEGLVERLNPELLLYPHPADGFARVLEQPELSAVIENLEAHNPIEHLAFLRGMLPLLQRLYDDFDGTVEAKYGSPLPVAERGVNSLFRPTPPAETCGVNELLSGSGFYLFEFGASEGVPVILDFRHRERLDELTWLKAGRLPRIATIHPKLGEEGLVIGEENDSWFFDVRPRDFDVQGVLAQLRQVAGEVEIALLPELSLPKVDILEKALAEDPGNYPPIVVAGSAHLTEAPADAADSLEVRANESRIYIDGRQVSAHRKIHPFKLRRTPAGQKLAEPLLEGITKEPKPLTVLASEYTRMGIVICADAHDRQLHAQLEDAGVNILLVPALTPEPGGFNGGICGLASRCQGVSVIANADTTFFSRAEEPPFAVMVAVPRGKAAEQSREFTGPDRFPATAVIDPNHPLENAVEWWFPESSGA